MGKAYEAVNILITGWYSAQICRASCIVLVLWV